MTQWYVKDLSNLTKVSSQTLHHYDRIGLLKPSVRLANGYRLYSENDLWQLQQIIALKCFKFRLAQIKAFLESNMDIADHFLAQAQLLEKKAQTLLEASQCLKNIAAKCRHDESAFWECVVNMSEAFRKKS